jgi:hypothetical protein
MRNPKLVTQLAADSLSPPNGERAGVRGKYLKIKCLFIPALSSIANGGEGEKPNCATANPKRQLTPPAFSINSRPPGCGRNSIPVFHQGEEKFYFGEFFDKLFPC